MCKIVTFAKSMEVGKNNPKFGFEVSKSICKLMKYFENTGLNIIKNY